MNQGRQRAWTAVSRRSPTSRDGARSGGRGSPRGGRSFHAIPSFHLREPAKEPRCAAELRSSRRVAARGLELLEARADVVRRCGRVLEEFERVP